MPLFDTLEKHSQQTNHSSGFIPLPHLDVLYNLPLPLVVRDEKLTVIFQNKMMDTLAKNEATNYVKQNGLQWAIQKKAAFLISENNFNATQVFEVACEDQFFEIHHTLQQAYTGERFIIETIKDITADKVDAIVQRLLYVEEGAAENFLDQFTSRLSEIFQLDMVLVAKTNSARQWNSTLSCRVRGKLLTPFTYLLKDTPCAVVYELGKPLEIEKGARTLFPYSSFLKENQIDGIYGIPLTDPNRRITGNVFVGNRSALTDLSLLKQVLQKLTTKLTLEVSLANYQANVDYNKAFIRQALNSFKDPVCILSKHFKLRSYNDAYAKFTHSLYGVDISKSKDLIDLIFQTISSKPNHTKLLAQFIQRKELFAKSFQGEKQSIYAELEIEQERKHYLFYCNPIFNLEQTEVGEVLLIVHDITELINSKQELELLKKHYHSIFETNLLGIGIYDTIQEKWLDMNDQFLTLYGEGTCEKKTALKVKLGQFSPILQPDGISSESRLKAAKQRMKHNEKFVLNWTHTRRNGENFPTVVSFIPLNDEDKPGLYCIAIKDISEHLAHQVLLEHKNRELEQYIKSNLQLENLAYTACHDLKEPLRTIGTFTQIIKNKYEHLIDDKSKEYMNFIINGVTRMNYFVDGLFEYARVRESKNEFESFNLNTLLEFVQLDLNQSIREKNVCIELSNIPDDIIGNRTKIKQLFQNLIANAIKFQQSGAQPVVKISCTSSENHWHFTVSDNGIGIAPAYFDQIFTLFRKLHSKDQYEGSGIGLALCKEIVEQHKGDIRVSSEPGQGTTFSFDISKNLPV